MWKHKIHVPNYQPTRCLLHNFHKKPPGTWILTWILRTGLTFGHRGSILTTLPPSTPDTGLVHDEKPFVSKKLYQFEQMLPHPGPKTASGTANFQGLTGLDPCFSGLMLKITKISYMYIYHTIYIYIYTHIYLMFHKHWSCSSAKHVVPGSALAPKTRDGFPLQCFK